MQIYNTNVWEFIKTVPDNTYAAIICDPPYDQPLDLAALNAYVAATSSASANQRINTIARMNTCSGSKHLPPRTSSVNVAGLWK